MARILITGANRGIGRALAVTLSARGHTLIAASRRPAEPPVDDPRLRHVDLDVTDRPSIRAAAAALADEPLDIVINNAGIFGPRGAGLGRIDDATWHEVFATNVIGAYRVSEAFLPHLRRGRDKKLVTISSRMGSMGANTTGGEYVYRSSKAAANAVMRSLAIDLAPEDITVAVLHPGWVRTDMGGAGATLDVETSAAGLATVILGLTPADSGGFFNYDGASLVW
jgi:NAD(P)-dependent dehydrogenase (short-subunit alcohol dehydrogenase family)